MNMSATPPIPTLADPASTPGAKRGRYGEIISINGIPARQVLDRFRSCLPERFVEFDRAGRGDALNVDLYGHCPAQNVAIVQVRHAFRRARKHHMNLHKDYVLCGFNELTHAPFRHPVSAKAVRASIRKHGFDPATPVYAAQRWMWQVTEKQLAVSVRQGDMLLVPASRKPAGTTIPDQVHLVGGSHEVRSPHIVVGRTGRVFAWAPTIWHTKGQHAAISAGERRWYSVRVAQEEEARDWSERLGD